MSSSTKTPPDTSAVEAFLRELQSQICARLESLEPEARFDSDQWTREAGGGGDTRTLSGGKVFERAGVAFSMVYGDALPPAASKHRPHIAGEPWLAMGVSVVVHPLNPYAPTSHCNVRFFTTQGDNAAWWFGGGFDLTPYYGFDEDAIHWHSTARDACLPHGQELYARLKKQCDDYFFLPHRNEPRGIGGLFFDDYSAPGFDSSFALMRDVGQHYMKAYLPIIQRRKDMPFGEREREWQHIRRGRYVEFNLVHDRGTLFGLQSGGRTESILMSMPPQVTWKYNYQPEAGTAEHQLLATFLKPKEWL